MRLRFYVLRAKLLCFAYGHLEWQPYAASKSRAGFRRMHLHCIRCDATRIVDAAAYESLCDVAADETLRIH